MAAPNLVPEDRIERILSSTRDLAVMPHVVFKVLEMSSADDSSAASLEAAVQTDPGLSTKVLSIANSAAFALPTRVTSINQAIMFIGLRQMRQLCMTAGLVETFVGRNDASSLRRRQWWRTAVDTGLAARKLAQDARVEAESAYACGLLHLVGKSVLDRFDKDGYATVEAMVAEGVNEAEAETRVFQCDHVTLGQAVADRWKLPDEIKSGIAYTVPASVGSPHVAYRGLVSISHMIATFAKEGHVTDGESPFTYWAVEVSNLADKTPAALIRTGLTAIAEGTHMHA